MPRPTKAVLAAPSTFQRLRGAHPDAHCELEHQNPFQLIVATVLSAQSTDVIVNKVTPELFAKYPDARALAAADPAVVEKVIGRLGMFRQKTKNLIGLAKKLVADHGGEVPRSLDELVKLSGVGRKTANVVLGVAFQAPEGVVVDTHVQRITQRLGWTRLTMPEAIEQDLMKLFPRRDWDMLSHVLIFHGRRICYARKPACATCPVRDACPSAFKAELVGRKAPRVRIDADHSGRGALDAAKRGRATMALAKRKRAPVDIAKRGRTDAKIPAASHLRKARA
jgi:endonuclease III